MKNTQNESTVEFSDTDGTGTAATGAVVLDYAAPAEKIYRIGTLEYTKRALIIMFAWLLWGDLCFVIFESIFQRVMPLYLKSLEASDVWISTICGSISGAVVLFLLPHISMATDQYRSRLGRRIPFLLVATPCTVTFMCLLGFAPEIGAWLHPHLPFSSAMTMKVVILTLMAVFAVFFHFFNMILNTVFACLTRDVMPPEAIPWCLTSFRIVGLAGGLIFNWYIFPHAIEDRQWVCVGVGGLYTVVFTLMCWKVKEGEYPPPEPKQKRAWGVLKNYWDYCRSSVALPVYRNFIIAQVLIQVGLSASYQFGTLFQKETLGMTMWDIAYVQNWVMLATVGSVFLAGWVCSRIQPLKVYIGMMMLVVAVNLGSFWFIDSKASVLTWSLIAVVPSTVYGLALGATNMTLLSKEKYAQLYTAAFVFAHAIQIVASMSVGVIMDATGHYYRLFFVIAAAVNFLALVPMIFVYRQWKLLGGEKNYVPPVPA